MDPRLENRTIVLGISGGIACYKACELVRRLTQAGAQVRVAMTASARQFVQPMTLQTLSMNPVATELFDLTQESEIGHINLARAADALVIAPATANIMAKLAHGIADDVLTTVALACTAPLVIAPAMNVQMWRHVATQTNLKTLRERGAHIVDPGAGDLACGEVGEGRLAETEQIIEAIAASLTPRSLQGVRFLITAGPTREPVDPVRYLTNRSSGKMGYALARAAQRRGAQVTLVSGPVSLAPPAGMKLIKVETAREMHDAVMGELDNSDVIIKSAAVADFAVAGASEKKLKRRETQPTIELTPNPDILAAVGKKKGQRVLVGFAAETHDLKKYAREKLREKNADLFVANDVARADAGFDVDTNQVELFFADGREESTGLLSKDQVAERVLDAVESLLPEIHRRSNEMPA
ncbi:MAG: bifunctional phosphopantothenoylcysteine decarboxylase/phosphopantothenate--cysteine ligase CoaBC [Chrysiogenetes bacterium]|nr:bifunctional phosphopantothenoylcysteine decarboxylase/phosphopantothenate--cysteine ligase CoaBC [Chrysiogenetes bacterium]